jgi:hypothetical protein
MAKNAVTDWDTTAANNTDVGGINIQGTAPVSNMDDALRTIMAQIATFRTGASFTGTLTGAAATFSGAVSASSFTSTQNFGSSTAVVVLGATGAGQVLLRPNGVGSTTGQMVIATTGNATVNGTLTATSGTFSSGVAITGTLSGTAVATAAQYRANTASLVLETDQVWSAAAEVTLTDAATIAVDMSTFINAVVTLGGNRALGNPTNEKVGQSGVIRIVQDATGSRTLTYGTDWEFAGGVAPVLSTAANAQDLLFYYVIATDRIFGNLIKATA